MSEQPMQDRTATPLTAALVVLARRGIPSDVQALLIEGDPSDPRILARVSAGKACRIFVSDTDDLRAIDTAVASTAMFAALASATIATSHVASHSLGRSRAPSCCCCFCAARLRRGGGGANCNARSPGTSLTSVSSLRR